MSQNQACIDPLLLAEQSRWVFSLASNLTHDPSGADDLAQETLLAGLAAPPEDANDPRRLRAWLGRVVFNLANLSTRRSVRRRAREEEVARPERESSAADTAIRKSILCSVGAAVEELREPYRSAVIMRYFEGRSTADIAASSNTTESAVRKRLWRARAQLRASLEPQHNGERQAWFQAALPLLGPVLSVEAKRPWGAGSLLVAGKYLVAGAAATLLLIALDSGDSSGSSGAQNGISSETGAEHGSLRRAAFLGYLASDPIETLRPRK